MDIVVQKYGGTSVENKEKLLSVIDRIKCEIEEDKKVVVIVSAQGKTTDNLVNIANEYCDKLYNKEMDLLLSVGEIQTVALLTMMLKDKGIDAIGLTGGQAGVITDSNFSNAKIKMILKENIEKHLESGKVVVIAGFQGIDKFGNITTLGRGGSDLSAVAIAASLKAEKCEIYTDVDGVFSSDPNVIHNAKLIKEISYEEMLEAASTGAKVLHDRAVNVARKYKLKLNVKNTNGRSRGTDICEKHEDINEENVPKIVAIQKELAKITIVGGKLLSNADILINIYKIASDNNITLHMMSFSEVAISIVVKQIDAENFAKLLHDKIIGSDK